MKRILTLLVCLLSPLCSFAADSAAPHVDTPLGKVVGRFADGNRDVEVYKGIPYAVPPVGSRRWKPAEPTSAWPEPLIADRFGPDCVQPATMDIVPEPEKDWYYHAPSLTSEDCLYLNVWRPASREQKSLPVMVWIHGGGLVQGSGSWPLYDGAQLARKGVVLITLNYRLGVFARFAHPELTAESPWRSSGAYDMSDLIRVLQWVQQNVAAFGGDPGNVTVFGESAGSLYVAELMSSPLARGLFHRAIGESGGAFYDHMPTLETAEAKGVELANAIGQPTLTRLRELPAAELLKRSREQKYFMDPVVEGHFLPETPCKVFEQGKQIDVPLLVGFNGEEHYGYRPPLPAFENFGAYEKYVRGALNEMAYLNPGLADGFLALLPKSRWTSSLAPRAIRGYAITGWEMESWAAMMSRVSSKAYLYYFSHVPAGSQASFHTAELSYVFNNERDTPRYSPNMPTVSPPPAADLALAEALSDYWVAFARTGVPAVKGRPDWKPFVQDQARHFMEFKAGAPVPGDRFFPELQHKSICQVLR